MNNTSKPTDVDFIYHTVLDTTGLDNMGHINHAYYLTLCENARWAWAETAGVGKTHIQQTGVGWVILEAQAKYFKELHVGHSVNVHCRLDSFKNKIGKIKHTLFIHSEEIDQAQASAEVIITFGFFDLKQRKLVVPDQKSKAAFNIN